MAFNSAWIIPPQGQTRIETITISGNSRAHVGNVINFELPEDAVREMRELRHMISQTVGHCTELNQALKSNPNAAEQLQEISHEPTNLHHILWTIQDSLDDSDTSHSVLWAAQVQSIKSCLETCQATLVTIANSVKNFEGHRVDPKDPEARVMSRMDFDRHRQALASQKINLNIAISIGSMYQTRITQEYFDSHRQRLEITMQELENEKAKNLPEGLPHYDKDRSMIPVDLEWSTKRFFDVPFIFTDDIRDSDPSMQVSSYLGQESTQAEFWSCASSFSHQNTSRTGLVTIFVTGLPSQKHSLAIGVDLDDSVAEVRSAILKRTSTGLADFALMHSNKIFTNTNATLREYGVRPDATLRCVSFRLDRLHPGPWAKTYKLKLLAVDQSCVTLQLMSHVAYPASYIQESFIREFSRVKGLTEVLSVYITLFSQGNRLISGRGTDTVGGLRACDDTTMEVWIFHSRRSFRRYIQGIERRPVWVPQTIASELRSRTSMRSQQPTSPRLLSAVESVTELFHSLTLEDSPGRDDYRIAEEKGAPL